MCKCAVVDIVPERPVLVISTATLHTGARNSPGSVNNLADDSVITTGAENYIGPLPPM